jgi:hypothetical protein
MITTIRDTIAKELCNHNFIATPDNDTKERPFIQVEITTEHKGEYHDITVANLYFQEDKINISELPGSYRNTILYADPDMFEKLLTFLEKQTKKAIDEFELVNDMEEKHR